MTIDGHGFGTDTSAVELYVDGVKQTVLTCTDTQMTFTLGGALDENSNNVQIYLADGYPTGYGAVKSLSVVPTLVSISPATGSSGGTLLTVTATGVGTNSTGINLVIASSGVEVCAEVNMTAYGTFTCLTNAMEITSADELQLKTSSGNHACGNLNTPADCTYVQ